MPLAHLAACAGVHYRLQLNCYRYILEKYYGVIVEAMYVVCTHPGNGSDAVVDCVPVMHAETEKLMKHQRERCLFHTPCEGKARVAVDPFGAGSSDDSPDFDARVAQEQEFLQEVPGCGSDFWPAASRAAIASASAPAMGAASPVQIERMPDDSPQPGTARQGLGRQDSNTVDMCATQLDEFLNEHATSNIAIDSSHRCKQRRLMKGAAASASDFDALFNTCSSAAVDSIHSRDPDVGEKKATILERTKRLKGFVWTKHTEWCDHQVRLAAAALAIYRMRLVDMFIREHVLLVWIIEGGRLMRAHGGCVLLVPRRWCVPSVQGHSARVDIWSH